LGQVRGLCKRVHAQWDRHWIATVLTAWSRWEALGTAAQVALVDIIGHVMQVSGLELLSIARDLAGFDLPAPVGSFSG